MNKSPWAESNQDLVDECWEKAVEAREREILLDIVYNAGVGEGQHVLIHYADDELELLKLLRPIARALIDAPQRVGKYDLRAPLESVIYKMACDYVESTGAHISMAENILDPVE